MTDARAEAERLLASVAGQTYAMLSRGHWERDACDVIAALLAQLAEREQRIARLECLIVRFELPEAQAEIARLRATSPEC